MNKPIELARQDFIDGLVSLVNEAGLPAFVVADVLRGIITEVDALAKSQYEAAKRQYEEEESKKA